MPSLIDHELNLEEEFSFHGLSLEEEPSLMVTDPIYFESYSFYILMYIKSNKLKFNS